MKILIPDYLEDVLTKPIKDISSDIDIDVLDIEGRRSLYVRGLNYVGRRYLPYSFYERIRPITGKTDFSISVNGQFGRGVVSDADVLLASWRLKGEILSELIPRLPNLRWIHTTWTGVEHILSCGVDLGNLKLTNIGKALSRRVAEFALALILSAAKSIPDHIKLSQKRKWARLPSRELTKTTVGIIGLGNIGKELAGMTKALGMRVIAVNPTPKKCNDIDMLLKPQELGSLLSQSDFVVLCCALNEKTKKMISNEELRSMREDAYLINVARGGLIDEKALRTALKERWIKGACLDVFEVEPLPYSSPFYNLRNIVISHHSAFTDNKAMTEPIDEFLSNLENYIENKPLLNEIKGRSETMQTRVSN